jgi:hypothetical protein
MFTGTDSILILLAFHSIVHQKNTAFSVTLMKYIAYRHWNEGGIGWDGMNPITDLETMLWDFKILERLRIVQCTLRLENEIKDSSASSVQCIYRWVSSNFNFTGLRILQILNVIERQSTR